MSDSSSLLQTENRQETRPTRNHVLQEDANMGVPVRACLLVVEAQSVEELVLDGTHEHAALAHQ